MTVAFNWILEMADFRLALCIVITVGALAYFMNSSPPTYSKELTVWIEKGKTFTYNGHKIFYQVETNTNLDGTTLVCLHGFPSFSYDWHKMWPSLRSMYSKVVTLDFIGFGMSDKPQQHQYSLLEQADIVEALLKQLGVDKTHVLAHDYGDTVAQELLARYNERSKAGKSWLKLETVVLLNGGIFPETNFPRLSQRAMLIPYLNELLCRLMNFYTFKRAFSEVFGTENQPTSTEYEDFWAAIKTNDGNLVTPQLLGYIEERKKYRSRWVAALQNAVIPVHVIYGPSDPVNPPGFVDYYRKLIPNSEVTVLSADINHYPHFEDPKATTKAYRGFIDSISKDQTSK